MVASGELKAPVVIGRDHLDSGSVASPNRETEAMRDGSDAIADWPLLNALLNTASGATWVSIHHGGGVGIGFSQHAGMVIVCDGTPEAARRLERVLSNDPATGVMRHADAGYPDAIACAHAYGLDLPMLAADPPGAGPLMRALLTIAVLVGLLGASAGVAFWAWQELGEVEMSTHGLVALALGGVATFALGAGIDGAGVLQQPARL